MMVTMKWLFKRTHTPLDTNIVLLHRLLIAIMLTLFGYSNFAQMERQSPSCSGSGNINLQHERKLKLCITVAAFVEYKGQKKYPNGFDLYLPATLFIMALLYLIPLQCQKFHEDQRLVNLFEQAPHMPWSKAVTNIDVVIMYHKRLLAKRVLLSWECLEVNLCCLLILDIISSTNLLTKIVVGGITKGWDYVMDMWHLTYPTSVKCEIGPQMVYAASNLEHYRCIVPHNEIYKYIWLVATTVVLFATFLSFLALVYHMIQMLPFRRRHFFKDTVDINDKTLEVLTVELPGGDNSLFLLKWYLLRLPSKEQRREVIRELVKIVKETSY